MQLRSVGTGLSAVMLALAVFVGCSSDDASSSKPQVTPTAACPYTTVTAAAGAACSVEGAACGIGYPCGAFNQQAQCVCTGGTFACTDSRKQPVAAGAEPTCVSNGGGNGKECPATESGAAGTACTNAGLQCFYLGPVCTDGTQKLDTCECVSDGDGGLALHCEPEACNPSGDAGSAPADAGSSDAKKD